MFLLNMFGPCGFGVGEAEGACVCSVCFCVERERGVEGGGEERGGGAGGGGGRVIEHTAWCMYRYV